MYNISHLRYAIEVEKTASISKAAKNLYMGQPHLSKAIKELEDSMGTVLFNRTSKGVIPTPKGKAFLVYAKNILSQISEMEAICNPDYKNKYELNISVPRASYITYAFINYIKQLDNDKELKLNYRETNSIRAINNVAADINNIAIIRYQTSYEKYFLNTLTERELKHEVIFEYQKVLLMSKDNQLAKLEEISLTDLSEYIEITHGDVSVPSLPVTEARNLARTNAKRNNISIYERGSQFEIISEIPNTYMWVSPLPKSMLAKYGLVQRNCLSPENNYKDILIYRNNYHLSDEDEMFLDILKNVVKKLSI